MSDLESQGKPDPPVRASSAAPKVDWFEKWFFRSVQVSGLGAFWHEIVVQEEQRVWILVAAGSCMLGAVGVRLIVQWGLRKFEQIGA